MTHDRWQLVGLITAVTAVFLAAWAGLDAILGRSPMQRRLGRLQRSLTTKRSVRERIVGATRHAARAVAERLGGAARIIRDDVPLLERAAIAVRPDEWLVVRLAAALGGACVLTVLVPWWLGVPVGAAAGLMLPNVWLKVRINNRAQTFADELPGALQLVISSLRSGFTLHQAIEATVTDADGPVADELRRALSETRLGGELEEALTRVGDRTGSTDMKWLVMAIALQREVGGNLAEVMQSTADTMRERAYLRRHVRSLSAEGRLSAHILMALPVAIGGVLVLTRPGYLRPLYTEPVGIAMLLGAAVLMAGGWLWLRVVVRVEV